VFKTLKDQQSMGVEGVGEDGLCTKCKLKALRIQEPDDTGNIWTYWHCPPCETYRHLHYLPRRDSIPKGEMGRTDQELIEAEVAAIKPGEGLKGRQEESTLGKWLGRWLEWGMIYNPGEPDSGDESSDWEWVLLARCPDGFQQVLRAWGPGREPVETRLSKIAQGVNYMIQMAKHIPPD
jgi:hypothetical protein